MQNPTVNNLKSGCQRTMFTSHKHYAKWLKTFYELCDHTNTVFLHQQWLCVLAKNLQTVDTVNSVIFVNCICMTFVVRCCFNLHLYNYKRRSCKILLALILSLILLALILSLNFEHQICMGVEVINIEFLYYFIFDW